MEFFETILIALSEVLNATVPLSSLKVSSMLLLVLALMLGLEHYSAQPSVKRFFGVKWKGRLRSGALEQHVVFEVDVRHQVLAQGLQAQVERAPRVAGAAGQGDAVGQRFELGELFAVVVVLHAHHVHGRQAGVAHAALVDRKEHHLFLLHVALQLLLHVFEVVGQAQRALGAVAVHVLDAAGQADQLGQLLAVAGVVARQDVIDQVGRGGFGPVHDLVGAVLQGVELRSSRESGTMRPFTRASLRLRSEAFSTVAGPDAIASADLRLSQR